MKYVSPIPLPPEVEAEIARAPKRGTPERAAWVDNLREQAWKEGLRRFSGDEVLIAMERERAGYDGLGELWCQTPYVFTYAELKTHNCGVLSRWESEQAFDKL